MGNSVRMFFAKVMLYSGAGWLLIGFLWSHLRPGSVLAEIVSDASLVILLAGIVVDIISLYKDGKEETI